MVAMKALLRRNGQKNTKSKRERKEMGFVPGNKDKRLFVVSGPLALCRVMHSILPLYQSDLLMTQGFKCWPGEVAHAVIPALWEAEVEELIETRSSRPAWET